MCYNLPIIYKNKILSWQAGMRRGEVIKGKGDDTCYEEEKKEKKKTLLMILVMKDFEMG